MTTESFCCDDEPKSSIKMSSRHEVWLVCFVVHYWLFSAQVRQGSGIFAVGLGFRVYLDPPNYSLIYLKYPL